MTSANDLSARAQAALERVADRMPDLPKPVLAAIGAADLAGRQLFELVNKLGDKTGVKAPSIPERDEIVDELREVASDLPGKVSALATELPEKVQELVAELPEKAKDLADQLEQFATALPGKVQKLTDELPGKVSEVGEQLQPDQIKQTAEAYGQLLSTVFSTLAERGEKTWGDLRNNGPKAGDVVDAEPEKAAGSAGTAEQGEKTAGADQPKKAEGVETAAAPRTPRPARRKPAVKPSANESVAPKADAPKSATKADAPTSATKTDAAAEPTE